MKGTEGEHLLFSAVEWSLIANKKVLKDSV